MAAEAIAAASAAGSSKAAITAAGINAGTMAASNGFLGIGAKKQQKRAISAQREMLQKQLDYNREMNELNINEAERARQWAEDYYNKYESPYALMKQKQAAGINPYADSVAPVSPSVPSAPSMQQTDAYAQAGSSIASIIASKGGEENGHIASMIEQFMNLIPIIQETQLKEETIRKAKADAEGAEIANELASSQNDVWNMELTKEDLQTFEGYGINSDWYQNFIKNRGRKPSFKDLYWQALGKAPARDLNRRNGFAALEVSNPFVKMLINHRNNNDNNGGNRTYWTQDQYGNDITLNPDGSFDENTPTFDAYLQSLTEKLTAGRSNEINNAEITRLTRLIDSYKENRHKFGIVEDHQSIAGTIMNILYASNPEQFQKMAAVLGGVFDGSIFDKNIGDVLKGLFNRGK